MTILIVLKLFACLVSLASGFRGGLFFASLFVGSLLGKLYAIGIDAVAPSMDLETTACVLVGMGALSAAIVGGPLTMTFLVLESTGNLGVAGGVLAASIATTLAVRATFGYSFTTWRLHLRGETIRGGQDVGWLRDLTVGRMMVRSPPVFPAEESVRKFREAYPHRQRQCRRRGRRRRAISGADPCSRGARALDRERRGRRPDRRHRPSPGDCPHPDDDIGTALETFGAAARRHARRHRARNRAGAGHAWRSLCRAPLRAGDESGDEGGAGRRVGGDTMKADLASPSLLSLTMDAPQHSVDALKHDITGERETSGSDSRRTGTPATGAVEQPVGQPEERNR